jgi:hypothetical protein
MNRDVHLSLITGLKSGSYENFPSNLYNRSFLCKFGEIFSLDLCKKYFRFLCRPFIICFLV